VPSLLLELPTPPASIAAGPAASRAGRARPAGLVADDVAPPLDQHDVASDAVALPDPLANTERRSAWIIARIV